VLLVDTEGSFMAERADDIAAAFLQHLQRMVKHNNSVEKQASVSSLTWQKPTASQPDTACKHMASGKMSAVLDSARHCYRWLTMLTAGAAHHEGQPSGWHPAVPRAHRRRAAGHSAHAAGHAGGRSAGGLLPLCHALDCMFLK
jgi:hypothetical protein